MEDVKGMRENEEGFFSKEFLGECKKGKTE